MGQVSVEEINVLSRFEYHVLRFRSICDLLSASRPCRFTPGETAASTHRIGGWMDPTAGLNAMTTGEICASMRIEPAD
jgi:hypothetical protein